MISSISSSLQAYAAMQPSSAACTPKQAPAAASKQAEPAQDTVHLSAQALAASKDPDHDGDGH